MDMCVIELHLLYHLLCAVIFPAHIVFGVLNMCNVKYFAENQWHGHGELRQANGDIYVGDWQIRKRHGMGKQYYANNGTIYEGR
jgi:hypothetical protein